MSPRLVRSLVLAGIAVAVLGTSAYRGFERVRVRLVTESRLSEETSMAIAIPAESRFRDDPVAIILEVRGAREPVDFEVRLDDRLLARTRVPPERQIRIDTSVESLAGASHVLSLNASRPGWSLAYLEIATVHGYAGGIVKLVVVPPGVHGDRVLPVWGLLLLFAALAALQPRFDWRLGPVRYLHLLATGLVILLFTVALIAPVFTQFTVLLSLQTILLGAAIVYAEPLSRVRRRVAPRLLEGVAVREVPPLPGWREVLTAGAGLTLVVAVVFHVQVANMYSVSDLGDPLFSMWRMAWVAHQITADPSRLFDANIFYPMRGTLTYSDSIILPSLMNVPLVRAGVHPVVAYNLLFLSAFVFSGLAAYLLARGLGWGVPAAWGSALIFALYPYRLDHYSHLELQMAQWMPLALLGAHRLMAVGGLRHLVLTSLAVAAQWYSSMYYGLFLSVYLGVFALVLALVWRDWRRLVLAACAVLLGLGLAWPLARAYAGSQAERGTRAIEDVRTFSATPRDYLQSSDRSAVYATMSPQPGPSERALFPGLAPLALAAAGAWPPLTPARLALLAGGIVAFDGSRGTHGVWYPWAYEIVPPFQSIRVPARFAVLVGLTLALLAGAGLARLLARGWIRLPAPAALFAVTAVIAIDAWPSLHLVPVWREPPPIYQALGPSANAVLMEYPLNPEPRFFSENLPFMYFSVWHLTPTLNGYSGFIPMSYSRIVRSLEGFPGGETLPALQQLGVTHIAVVCAIDGRFEAFGVPVADPDKCDQTIRQLDADPRLRSVVRARWEGAPALLYELQRSAAEPMPVSR